MKSLILSLITLLLCNNAFSQEFMRHKTGNVKFVLVQRADTTTYLSPEFEDMGEYKNGGVAVQKNNKWGYIDSHGQYIIEPIYDRVDKWFCGDGENFTSVMHDGKWGLVDRKGKVVYPFLADWAICFTDGFAPYEISGKYGFINRKLDVIVKPQYDEVFNIHDGLVSVKKNNKWGVINSSGEIIVPIQYDFVFEFYEGMGQVELNKKFGYFNKLGKLTIPIRYDKADPYFKNGRAEVMVSGRSFYIDKQGNKL